jgi:hypothetical protein
VFERSLSDARREVLDLAGEVIEIDTGTPDTLERAATAFACHEWTR